jgi:putative DNA primase/helicase
MTEEHITTDKVTEIKKKVQRRAHDEAQSYPVLIKSNGHLPTAYVQQCMAANELGDGLLYASVMRNQYLYNASAGKWMRWCGHSWDIDKLETHLAAVEQVVDKLLDTTGRIGEEIQRCVKDGNQGKRDELGKLRDRIYKRIYTLRKDDGRNKAVKFARTCREPLAISGDELDLNRHLLACANGVLDLRTAKFREGRPEDLISRASPVEWQGLEKPAPIWERFLLEIQREDQETVDFLHRWFGYTISGIVKEHKFMILEGPGGRNGKGTLVETISEVLGPLAGPIQSEMLLDQGRTRSSAGPSPDIMDLRGLRMVWASENDEGRRFSPSRVKWISGGDTLKGRHPHDKYNIKFNPTHKLILLTNNKPVAPPDDRAFWERLLLVPFGLSYVDRDPLTPYERRSNKDLRDQLREEHPGILAWLVRGYLEYQRQGLNPPKSALQAAAKYRRDEDILAPFFDDYLIKNTVARTSASDLFDCFSDWYFENVSKKEKITQTRFGRIMGKIFDRDKLEGRSVYVGVELKFDRCKNCKKFHDIMTECKPK